MKTNSNTYTIIYATVIVVIVAFLLAFVSQALKPAQETNEALDKKKQILYSLNIRDLPNSQVDEKYKQVVMADEIINENNGIVKAGTIGGTHDGFKTKVNDYKAGKLALYICNVNGQRKYVIPVYGTGLWGPINGYIAINADKSTIYGAYFNHESETAGLGAEIKDNRKWQEQFQGKHLFSANDNSHIAISVRKEITDKSTQVDAVTGATLTSNGVTNMLSDCLSKYMKFLQDK